MTKQPHVLVLTLLGLLFLLPLSYGQRVPDAFSYQGLATNANGEVLSNQTVDLEVRIASENETIYSEITQVTTNAQGRFVLAVGAANEAAFSQIDWGAEPYFLIVYLNRELITDYAPLLSVPYALAANTALDDGDKDATNELQNLIYDQEAGTISLSNSDVPAIPLYNGLTNESLWQERGTSGIYYNQGNIELKRKDGSATSAPAILLRTLENNRGSITTYGENGNVNLALNNLNGRPNSGAIGVYGTKGKTGVFLYTDANDNGVVSIRDTAADTKVLISVNTSESGRIFSYGKNGNTNTYIGGLSDTNPNSGSVSVRGTEGKTGVLLYTDSNDRGVIDLIATEGNIGLRLDADSNNNGRVRIADKDSNTKLNLFVYDSGSGGLIVDGDNNNSNVLLSSLSDSPNNGFVAVTDESGTEKAGIYVNGEGQGIVFADEVRDLTQDPSDENSIVAYSVLEGPEAAAYDRGNFQLTNGEAFVPYSRHFKIVANANNATVQLTSTEWDTYGLAVVRKTSEGFYVKELKGGAGNFQFDWEVKAVRKGHETYKVFIEKSEVAKIASPKNSNPAQLTAPKSEKQE